MVDTVRAYLDRCIIVRHPNLSESRRRGAEPKNIIAAGRHGERRHGAVIHERCTADKGIVDVITRRIVPDFDGELADNP